MATSHSFSNTIPSWYFFEFWIIFRDWYVSLSKPSRCCSWVIFKPLDYSNWSCISECIFCSKSSWLEFLKCSRFILETRIMSSSKLSPLSSLIFIYSSPTLRQRRRLLPWPLWAFVWILVFALLWISLTWPFYKRNRPFRVNKFRSLSIFIKRRLLYSWSLVEFSHQYLVSPIWARLFSLFTESFFGIELAASSEECFTVREFLIWRIGTFMSRWSRCTWERSFYIVTARRSSKTQILGFIPHALDFLGLDLFFHFLVILPTHFTGKRTPYINGKRGMAVRPRSSYRHHLSRF